MDNSVQRKCELLVENRQLAGKVSFLENGLIKMVVAAAYTEKNRQIYVDELKDCIKLLRKKQGIFSDLRGNNELIIASKMALSGNPEKYLDDVLETYKKFQKGKFFGSEYRVLAASSICDMGRASESDAIVEKTNELLKGMKKDHPFLTSDEDTSLAVLLALKGKNVEEILVELEDSFQYIKKNFAFHENAAYSLSQVLSTYDGFWEQKAQKALDLFNAFKDAGAKYGKSYQLASLGVLINVNKGIDEIVSQVVEIAEFLQNKKGFGILDMDKPTRLMLGAMIVSEEYSDSDSAANASVTSGAMAAVIAQQLCMYAAVIAATSASSSSSSN